MATFLPQMGNFFDDLNADSDSGSEFDGFDADEIDSDREDRDQADDNSFDMANWAEGDAPPTRLPFTGVPGITERAGLPDNPNVIDYFNVFVKEEDYESISQETNRYAAEYIEQKGETLRPNSRFHAWKATTAQEIKVFLAMIIAMGLVVQLELSEYWSTGEVTDTPFFPKLMSRDRFWLLLSFFHLANNANYIRRGLEGYDPLFKLGALFKNLIRRFHRSYTPNRQLSLDEGMVPWRGNLSFRVYNPDKPKRYGIKAYMLCDAANGYCTKFCLYTGKYMDVIDTGNGATYNMVMHLMRDYFGKGYIIYMDNYYSSPTLYWDLYDLGVGASGTLRVNRKGVPQAAKDKVLRAKGDTYCMNNKHLKLVKYNDRKVVYLLSTVEKGEKVATGKTDPRTREAIKKPEIVVNYDKYMGGVDRSDQMVSYATFNARTLKWWKRVIFHVISLTVLNAYILYKTTTNDRVKLLHRQFRKKLVGELVSSVQREDVPGMNSPTGRPRSAQDPILRLVGRHFPEKIVGTGKKKTIARSCAVCVPAERKKDEAVGVKRKRPGRESAYQCSECQKALCVDPCFRLFHTYKDHVKAYTDLSAPAADDVDSD